MSDIKFDSKTYSLASVSALLERDLDQIAAAAPDMAAPEWNAGGGAGENSPEVGDAEGLATAIPAHPADHLEELPSAVGVHTCPAPAEIDGERWRIASEGAGLGCWRYDFCADYFGLDEEAGQRFEYEEAAIDGSLESWQARIHPADLPRVRQAWKEHLAGVRPRYEAEYRVRSAANDWIWVLDRGQIVARSKSGGVLLMAGIHADLPRRMRQQSSSRDLFVAGLSHEIRTPLAAILGFAEMLGDGDLAEGERNRAAATIRENGEHLLQLLNDLLDLSKIRSGRMEVEQQRCSPFDVLESVRELAGGQARAKGLIFETKIEGSLPETILSDATRLRQVLHNLSSNAVKFTEVGSVRIHACRRNHDQGPDQLEISIRDTGVGLSEEQLVRIFEPYTQADASTARRFGGTGLGLSISRQLANLLGGRLDVESTPGEGSTFTLVIPCGDLQGVPLVDATTAAASRASQREIARGRAAALPKLGGNYLLAEDSRPNQMLLQQILKRAGARVEVVDDGEQALDRARQAQSEGVPFTAILMDMHMPNIDGYVATETLRAEGYEAPIIALTANARGADRSLCLSAGCDAFFSKPVDRVALIEYLAPLEEGQDL